MPSITKNEFAKSVNVGTPDQLLAHAKAKTTGRPDQARILKDLEGVLAKVDYNSSGLLLDHTKEIDLLWNALDDFDKNGRRGSVTEGKGTAYELVWALMTDRQPGRVAEVAANIVDSPEGKLWGQETGDRAPLYNPDYQGGGPDRSGAMKSPGYLNGRWKCSVFAGEMLFRAGFEPPYSSYGLNDPRLGHHYEMACLWHEHTKPRWGQRKVLESVADAKDLQPGDIVTFQRYNHSKDRFNRRGDGGHVMVVTSVDNGKVQIAEASRSEAQFNDLARRVGGEAGFGYGTDLQALLGSAQKSEDRWGTYFEQPKATRVRFLRPCQAL